MTVWTAVVLAGSRPGGDPFAREMGVETKALIPVGGVPMIRRPVEALLASPRIGAVIVFAQNPAAIATILPAELRLKVEQSRGTIADTLLTLCEDSTREWPLLVTTADHALLDSGMIEDMCSRAGGADIAIGVVERHTLENRFPRTRRTWLRFRGGAYSGANLFTLRTRRVASALNLWRSVEQDRKKAWRLLWAVGPALFAGAVLRLRTLDQTLRGLSRKLDLHVRAVELRNPIACIDVDKAADLSLAERILEARS